MTFNFFENPLLLAFLIPLMVWALVWKGFALWRAARDGHKKWFIALLVINTAGIFEILYIYIFSERLKHPVVGGEPYP